MITALRQVPVWAWLIAGLIVALAGGLAYQTLQLAAAEKTHSDYVSGIERAAREAGDKAREEESRRQLAIDKVRQDAQTQLKVAAADSASAQRAADSLQLEVNRLLANRAAQNTELAKRGATIRDLTSVLADLRQRADQRAGELAAVADSSRIAGLSCEAAYDALTKKTFWRHQWQLRN